MSGFRHHTFLMHPTDGRIGPTQPNRLPGFDHLWSGAHSAASRRSWREHVVMPPLMLSMPVLALAKAIGSADIIRPTIGLGVDRILLGI